MGKLDNMCDLKGVTHEINHWLKFIALFFHHHTFDLKKFKNKICIIMKSTEVWIKLSEWNVVLFVKSCMNKSLGDFGL